MLRRPHHFFICVRAACLNWRVWALFLPIRLVVGCAAYGASACRKLLLPWPLVGYTALFLLLTHLFVRLYEEPTLRRLFGAEYEAYSRRVKRWRPTLEGPPG